MPVLQCHAIFRCDLHISCQGSCSSSEIDSDRFKSLTFSSSVYLILSIYLICMSAFSNATCKVVPQLATHTHTPHWSPIWDKVLFWYSLKTSLEISVVSQWRPYMKLQRFLRAQWNDLRLRIPRAAPIWGMAFLTYTSPYNSSWENAETFHVMTQAIVALNCGVSKARLKKPYL